MPGSYMYVVVEVEQGALMAKSKRSGKMGLLSLEARALAATKFL